MKAHIMKLGTKLELELINSLGQKIGQTYISQLLDIVDMENIIIAAPIHEARLMLITAGTKVRMVFLHEKYGLLSFTGIITSKEKKESIIALYARIDSEFERIQRRSYYRLDCQLNAGYTLLQENQDEETEKIYKKAITKNISGNGACIVVEDDIPRSSQIEVVINLSKEVNITVVCKVIRNIVIEVRKGKMHELGLYFAKISDKDQDLLVRYIFDQQRHLLKNNITEKK